MSAKRSRHELSQPSQDNIPRRSSCCCSWLGCFNGSASEPSSEMYLDNSGEATELLLEKMVVQRVPVRMFATEEDYRRMKREEQQQQLQSFDKYYSSLPKTDINSVSGTKVRPLEESDISLIDGNVDVEVIEEKMPVTDEPARKSSINQRRLVTNVLNKLSSLHTLGSKGIPKDPCPVNIPKRPPDALAKLPSHWKQGRYNATQEVNAATLQAGGRDLGKELSPEMKDTLLMLGTARKPSYYKFNKYAMKSQPRKGRKENTDSVGIQSTDVPYPNFIVLPQTSYSPDNYRHQQYSPAFHDEIFPTFNKNLFHDPQMVACFKKKDEDEETKETKETKQVKKTKSKQKMKDKSKQKEKSKSKDKCNCPEQDYCTRHHCKVREAEKEQRVVEPESETVEEKRSVKKVKRSKKTERVERSQEPELEPVETCSSKLVKCTSLTEDIPENEQVTEIKQLKGNNLKWRIIIKHRDNKENKE